MGSWEQEEETREMGRMRHTKKQLKVNMLAL